MATLLGTNRIIWGLGTGRFEFQKLFVSPLYSFKGNTSKHLLSLPHKYCDQQRPCCGSAEDSTYRQASPGRALEVGALEVGALEWSIEGGTAVVAGRREAEGLGVLCMRKPHNKVTSEQGHEDRGRRSHVTIWRTFQTTGMERPQERNRLHREMPRFDCPDFLFHTLFLRKALGDCFRPQLHGFNRPTFYQHK